eukprot:gnl/TRDRNA2_/TRDRNA2_176610_c0_seq11.p1 gnl/TRDRNA2_/TRDRNA2_176610_c0~~gnl/TRDRNA2_/TRDRNA2_176610_c0_seq11.p1  ORF type:complete len:103 (-),score=16.99 gnl/TRDRNA2_/TRDRNA2_176610_c0_seq11:36-344(-)
MPFALNALIHSSAAKAKLASSLSSNPNCSSFANAQAVLLKLCEICQSLTLCSMTLAKLTNKASSDRLTLAKAQAVVVSCCSGKSLSCRYALFAIAANNCLSD